MPARLINIKYITTRAEKVASPVTALQRLYNQTFSLETKGLKVYNGKQKLWLLVLEQLRYRKKVDDLVVFIDKGVYNNVILCTLGLKWVHKWCRGVKFFTRQAHYLSIDAVQQVVMSCMRVCRKQALSRVKYYYYVTNKYSKQQ